MAVTWESYLPEVAPHLPGAPYFEMVDAVRDAAIELAARSRLLKTTLAAINVVADQTDYTLTPPTDTRVVSVVNGRFDGANLKASSEEEMDSMSAHWREGGAVYLRYYCTVPETLSLAWAPTTAITGGLVIRVAYKPSQTSDDGDNILYNDWDKVIAAGAVGTLKGTGDETAAWYDPRGAMSWRAAFYRGVNDATRRAATGHTTGGQRVRMRPLA